MAANGNVVHVFVVWCMVRDKENPFTADREIVLKTKRRATFAATNHQPPKQAADQAWTARYAGQSEAMNGSAWNNVFCVCGTCPTMVRATTDTAALPLTSSKADRSIASGLVVFACPQVGSCLCASVHLALLVIAKLRNWHRCQAACLAPWSHARTEVHAQ